MYRIQKIPFYLPLHSEFSTDNICIDTSSVCGILTDEFYPVGGRLLFTRPLHKYVITSRFGDVIKEHVFVSPTEFTIYPTQNQAESMFLYPTMIKTFDLSKNNRFRNFPILLRKGLEEYHNAAHQEHRTYCTFLSNTYLKQFINYYKHNNIRNEFTDIELFRTVDALLYTFKQYDNDPKFEIGSFDIDQYLDTIVINRLSGMDIGSSLAQKIYDDFNPYVLYDVYKDVLTRTSLEYGCLYSKELKSIFDVNGSSIDEVTGSGILQNEINNSDSVIFVGSTYDSIRFGDAYEYSTYALYELFQMSPYTDVYLEYILHNDELILTNHTVLHNYYINITEKGNSQNHWVFEVTKEIDILITLLISYLQVINKVEVTLQDYHVLISLYTTDKKFTILFDMIAISLISRSTSLEIRHNFNEPFISTEYECIADFYK